MTLMHSIATERELLVENSFQNVLHNRPMIHIFIPAYNEQKSITSVLHNLTSVLDGNYQYQITVIDDGSKDNTSKLVKNFPGSVELIQNSRNRGKGVSIRRALSRIRIGEIVVFMDADGEHKPEDIPRVIRPILNNEADMVIGSRFLPKSQNQTGSYLNNGKEFNHIRKLGNNIFALTTFFLFQNFISDTQSGFRAFRVLPGLKLNLISRGFQIEMEMTIEALRHKIRVTEVPIENGRSSRGSYMRIIMDSCKIFFIIIQKRFLNSFTRLFGFLYL